VTRVAVLIPNFNGADYLGTTLAALASQTFTDWTAVVGDNASTDDSVDVVRAVGDERIALVRREENLGWVRNLNLLVRDAPAAEYLAILHSDDWWEPTFLASMIAAMDDCPQARVASSATAHHFSNDGHVDIYEHPLSSSQPGYLPPRDAVRYLTSVNSFTAPSVLARSVLYQELPRFDETLPLTADWLMWLRAVRRHGALLVPGVLAHYRIHARNTTAALRASGEWARDLVRFNERISEEWRADEPYRGAQRRMARGLTVGLLIAAQQSGVQGQRPTALLCARSARGVAPSVPLQIGATLYTMAARALSPRSLRVIRDAIRLLRRRSRGAARGPSDP
jgi:glycosyltransferase involved in cell wall biosynthesis